jgi:tetratricopeptide (TPR) repeat protein
VLAREPESVGALQLLSFVRLAEGQAAEAIAVGRRTIAAAPDHPSNQHNLGLMPARLGRPDEALESYDRPLAPKPGFIDV